MANKIILPRGLKANMPALSEGEIAFATDEKNVYVGTADGNVSMGGTVSGGGTAIDNISVTIPETGWKSGTHERYPKYYDIEVTGLTASDCADITIAVDSLDTAIACEMCPTTETLDGKIRIRAVGLPTEAISAQYRIIHGKE